MKVQPMEAAETKPATKQVEDPPTSRFVWKIKNFSISSTRKHKFSDVFIVGTYKWKLLIYPKGNNVDYLSVYLNFAGSRIFPYAQFTLSIVDQMHSNYTITKDTQHQFSAAQKVWGYTSFMPLADLHDPSRGYLVNDTCVVEAEVTVCESHTPARNLVDMKATLTEIDAPARNLVDMKATLTEIDAPARNLVDMKATLTEIDAPARNLVDMKATLTEIDAIVSAIVGLDGVKLQLRKWIKGLVLYHKRKELGLKIGTRKALHMAFLGHPGTGKTMVARLLANILHKLGLVSTDKVTEVQRTDLVGQYIGQTGPKTRLKIQEARGGVLFVDEAYRLVPHDKSKDYGVEALEEIMSAMDGGDIIAIFAGYGEEMERVFSANAGFSRRVGKVFYFDDYTPVDIANILHSKVNAQKEDTFIYGFKLHPDCTAKAIASLIKEHIPDEQLKKLNAGLVEPLLINSLENMDLRLDADCVDVDTLTTITMEDLEEGFKSLSKSKEKAHLTYYI